MFDWTQHGAAETWRFRSDYDAGEKSTTRCAIDNRPIRHCFVMRDRNDKSVVIGSCCFHRFEGLKTRAMLEAAHMLQMCRCAAIEHDIKLHAPDEFVREYRTQWQFKRKLARFMLRQYRNAHGDWLPKPLYDLQSAVQASPRTYKSRHAALRWYLKQVNKLTAQIEAVESSMSI